MTISLEGASAKVDAGSVSVIVSEKHPLMVLANSLPWENLMGLCAEDLKKTTKKGCWWTGRKIQVRTHLAAYFLQKLYNLTDRQLEYGLKDNAAFQLFCGSRIIPKWHAPDHTKIEEFRSRLSADTQRSLANSLAQLGVHCGYGDPSQTDIDSTVQEANMAYPSDATLLPKLCGGAKKLVDYLMKHAKDVLPEGLKVDMKTVKEKARSYFFLPKNAPVEKRREVFRDFFTMVKHEMRPVVDLCKSLDSATIAQMPWNVRRAYDQIKDKAWRYLLDVAHFTRSHTIKAGKILSLHCSEVACIKKGKVGKENEFGRVFQLGRIGGNFLFALNSTSVRMNDKESLVPMLAEHQMLFGENTLTSLSTDKGYWSNKNLKAAAQYNIKDIGLQPPTNIKRNKVLLPTQETQGKLRDRRAGIEPLIGHVKHRGQLGKSRMKSDAATLAAGYASVLGFNMRQLIRHQGGKMKEAC